MPAVDLADAADVLSRTIFAEARSEGLGGMEAVACVILTRASHPSAWGKDVLSVCLAPYQFSCWLLTDPQAGLIRGDLSHDVSFVIASIVARLALAGRLVDHTGGADHYANLARSKPSWAAGRTPSAVIGRHTFFRLTLPPLAHATPAPAA